MKKFGELILQARTRSEYSLQTLSDLVGGKITPSYINRLEKGEKSNPAFIVVCLLVQALDLDFYEVLGSFGYKDIASSSPHLNADILITDEKGSTLSLECKANLSSEQKVLLNRAVTQIIHYVQADKPYGHLPNVVEVIENIRESKQKERVSKEEDLPV